MKHPAFILIILTLFVRGAFAQENAPPAGPPDRLETIGEEFIIFEAGLAYLKHCDDFMLHQKQHPQYLRNATETIDMLAREIAAVNKGTKTKDAMNSIMMQKHAMSDEFDAFYQGKSACTSTEAAGAYDHLEAFQDMPSGKFRSYLKSKIMNKEF